MPYPNSTASVIVIAQTSASATGNGNFPFDEIQISGSNLFIITNANGRLTGSSLIPTGNFNNLVVTGAITASTVSASIISSSAFSSATGTVSGQFTVGSGFTVNGSTILGNNQGNTVLINPAVSTTINSTSILLSGSLINLSGPVTASGLISASAGITASNGWFNNLTVAGTLTANISGSATNASSASITANNNSSTTHFITFVDGTGNRPLYIDQDSLTWTPNTNTLSSSGPIVGSQLTSSGDIAINGGSILTSATTFNLATSATTINIGGTSTTSSFNGILDSTNTTLATIGGMGAISTDGGLYVGKNLIVSGSTTMYGDLTIIGTGSIVNISSSTLIIGDNRIQLNAWSVGGPQRYAGIDVFDSGSTTAVTSSLLWDSLNNYWLLQTNQSGSNPVVTSSAIILQGPTSSFGDEKLLTINNFLKVQTTVGNLITSSLSELGSNLFYNGTISASVMSASVFFGTSSWATNTLTASTVSSASNAFIQGGNSFGTIALLGTNDSQPLVFETSGSERMRIDTTGSVGIGTTNPLTKLHIVESVSTSSILLAVDGLSGRLFSIDDNLSGSLFSVNTIAGLPIIEAFSDNTVNIGKYNAEAVKVIDGGQSVTLGSGSVMYVSSSGRVGIGTSNPANKLSIIGAVNIGSSAYNTAAPANGLIVEGNVGIGTTTNLQKLNINGSTLLTNNNYHYGFTSGGSQTTLIGLTNSDNILIGQNNVNHNSLTIYGGLGQIDFNTSGSNRMRVDYNGNVGIGTTTLPLKLNVSGSIFMAAGSSSAITWASDISSQFLRYDNATDGMLLSSWAHTTFHTQQLERLRISSNGNVGIGVTNPTTLLQLKGDAASHQIFSINRSGSTTPALYIGNDSNNNALIASNNTSLRFGKDFTGTFNEYVRISSAGAVGIGTTNPSYLLDLYDTGASTGIMALRSSGSGNARIWMDASNGDLIGDDYCYIGQDNSLDFVINSAGTAGNIHIQPKSGTTSGILFVSGSTRLGNNTSNTHQFTGSVSINGSLNLSGSIIYDNAVLLDYGSTNMPTSSSVVLQTSTGSYNAAFFDYAIFSSSNSRAGTIVGTWNAGSVVYNETCTIDVGNTNAITMIVSINAGNVQLLASGSVTNWNIKASGRYI